MTWQIVITGEGPYELDADHSVPALAASLVEHLKSKSVDGVTLDIKTATFQAGAYGHDISDASKYDAFVKGRIAVVEAEHAKILAAHPVEETEAVEPEEPEAK